MLGICIDVLNIYQATQMVCCTSSVGTKFLSRLQMSSFIHMKAKKKKEIIRTLGRQREGWLP